MHCNSDNSLHFYCTAFEKNRGKVTSYVKQHSTQMMHSQSYLKILDSWLEGHLTKLNFLVKVTQSNLGLIKLHVFLYNTSF